MKRFLIGALLAIASSAVFATPAELTFCTGGATGAYEALGQTIGGEIARKTGATLDVINTGGSVENAQMMKEGDCVMAIMQADAVTSLGLPRDISVTNAHTEAVFWIHGKTGVKNFDDMKEEENLVRAVAYVAGSGAEVTVRNFGAVSEDFKKVKTVEFDDWYAAAEAVNQGFTMKSGVRIEVGGMIYVGRPGLISNDITDDFKDTLSIGEIKASAFGKAKDRNENPLYVSCKIDKNGDSGIPSDNSWTNISTYCMSAQVVYNNSWHANLDTKEGRNVKRAVAKAINSNLKAVRQ
jgi:TRAP-type uncharacterized transport system, periplasmic component